MKLTLSQRAQDGATVVEVAGDLDVYTCPQLRHLLLHLDATAHSRIVVDLEGCQWIDATGVAVMTGALGRARAQGGWLAVACDYEPVVKIFRVSGMARPLNLHASVGEAIAAMGATS